MIDMDEATPESDAEAHLNHALTLHGESPVGSAESSALFAAGETKR